MLNVSYYPAAVAAASGNGVVAGLFVPIANLPGMQSSELTDSSKERKITLSFANKIYNGLNAITDKLGLALVKSTPVGAGNDLIDQNFQYLLQYMIDWASGEVSVLPLPATNTGKIYLEQALGTGINFVTNEGAISGAGVLIPNSLITNANGVIPSDTSSADARSYLSSLIHCFVMNLDTATSVILNSKSTPAGIAANTAFLATNGVLSTDLNYRSFFSVTYNLTLRLQLNQESQTFDIAS